MMAERQRSRTGGFISKKRAKSLDNIKFFGKSNVAKTTNTDDSDFNCVSDIPFPDSISVDTNVENTPSWRDGRRIVELGHLASQLVCCDCGGNLVLNNITKETRYGFGSLLYIDCACGIINVVETNKRHRRKPKGPKAFDINLKSALGIKF